MANFMSSILDELMGRERNLGPDEKPRTISWDDPEICTHYMVSFCPNELFVNTKADLGTCQKLHDEQLRKKYQEEAPNGKKLQFENEFIRFAEKMVQDIEGKIKRGKMRIMLANGPDGGTYAGPGSKNAEKIALLTERVNVLLKEAEEAGCAGEVEKAQGLLKLCDQLKEEREQLKSNEISHPWNPDKAMQVCEVCGSYLIIGEAQHRLDDHIMGKQHMGFALLRKTMDDVKKARELRDKDERDKIEKERRERQLQRSGGGRDRDRDRRDHRRRSRSRDRDKDKKKKDDRKRRSRSRSPRRRSKSRERRDKDKKENNEKKRDSSRDRSSRKHSDDKDRDRRKKRSRSRSKDRHRRRRSRSHDKDKDRRRDKDRYHRDDKDKGKEESTKHSTNAESVPDTAHPEGEFASTAAAAEFNKTTPPQVPTSTTTEIITENSETIQLQEQYASKVLVSGAILSSQISEDEEDPAPPGTE